MRKYVIKNLKNFITNRATINNCGYYVTGYYVTVRVNTSLDICATYPTRLKSTASAFVAAL